eukprot:s345_g9.t4
MHGAVARSTFCFRDQGLQWRFALSFMSEMHAGRVDWNSNTLNAAISACERSGQWSAAHQKFGQNFFSWYHTGRCSEAERWKTIRVRAFGLKASIRKMRLWLLGCRSVLWLWQIFILQGQVAAILPTKFQPGPASVTQDPGSSAYFLTNGVLNARVSIKDGVLQPIQFTNVISGRKLPDPAYAFQVEVAGRRISSKDFRLLGANLSRLEPQAEASQLGLRHGGWSISFLLVAGSLEARWSVVLRDDSNSIKVAFRMSHHRDSALEVGEVCLLSGILNGGTVAGSVEGVPILSQDFFLGVEHPKATNSFKHELYNCCLQAQKAIALQTWQSSLTLGIVVPGQARRSFLHYLERERAHPSRRMLHYNTWYDIGTGQQFSAKEAEARLQHISKEMSRRGVVLDAFLLDDGWDDPDRGPWEPHDGFSSEALSHLEEISRGVGTSLGVWFSPFGGYHEPRPVGILGDAFEAA